MIQCCFYSMLKKKLIKFHWLLSYAFYNQETESINLSKDL